MTTRARVDRATAKKEVSLRVCVLGADGPGAAIAGYLAAGGAAVTLVTDEIQAATINRKGLLIESPRKFLLVKDGLRATSDPNPGDPFDLAILAGKASDAAVLLGCSKPLLARCKALVSIQNSVDFDLVRSACENGCQLLGASVTEFFEWSGEGMVRAQRPTEVDAYVGTFDDNAETEGVTESLVAVLVGGGLVAKRAGDIRQVIWEKQLQLANAACWSVLMLVGNPDLCLADGLAIEEGAHQFVETARELLNVYRAMGFEPQDFFGPRSLLGTIAFASSREAAVEQVLAAGRRHVAAGLKVRTPLHDDVLRRRKTQVEALVEPFIREAASRNLSMPLTETAFRAVKVLERSWR